MTTRACLFFCLVSLAVNHLRAGWIQTFSEEFNAETKLSSSWIPAFHWSPDPVGNNELQIYSPDALNFSTSSLQIIASKTTAGSVSYTSGVITTKDRFTQTFGYFEFRARWPHAKGLRAAFSLIAQDTLIGTNSMDIQFTLDAPDTAHFARYCNKTPSSTGTVQRASLTDGNFHKLGIQWTPDRIFWYIDETQVFDADATCLVNTPMYIAVNLAVGGDWAGPPDSLTVFPATMEIDYIRAYSWAPDSDISLPGPGVGIAIDMQNPPLAPPARIIVSNPSVSFGVFGNDDNTYLGVDLAGNSVGLTSGEVQFSVFPLNDKSKVIAVSEFHNVTLGRHSQGFLAIVNLTSAPPGYYRFTLGIFESGFSSNVIWLNTVDVFRVTAPTPVAPIAPVIVPVALVNSGVVPILDCYAPVNTSHYRAYFSYNNQNSYSVSVPIGQLNKLSPGAVNRGQPTVFTSGRSSFFPNSVFVTDINSNTDWILSSYTVSVDFADTSSLCPNSVTIVIVVSSPTALNSTDVNGLKEAIASQLNVTVGSVNINVTCTSQNSASSCEITVTVSVDPSQLSDLIQKAKDYVNDPVTVESNVKQISNGLSVTEVRGTKTDTEKQGTTNSFDEPTTVPTVISLAPMSSYNGVSLAFICFLVWISMFV